MLTWKDLCKHHDFYSLTPGFLCINNGVEIETILYVSDKVNFMMCQRRYSFKICYTDSTCTHVDMHVTCNK